MLLMARYIQRAIMLVPLSDGNADSFRLLLVDKANGVFGRVRFQSALSQQSFNELGAVCEGFEACASGKQCKVSGR